MITAADLRVRDPFIVTAREEQCYYLFLNSRVAGRADPRETVCVLKSYDLYSFEDPRPVLTFPEPCEVTQCWAPEVHLYDGKWYMFTTNSYVRRGCGVRTGALPPEEVRGTYVYVSDSVDGAYRPWSDGPLTPWSSLALDGTLFVDAAGDPWMVYCHEWLQTHNGLVEAIPLSRDLRGAAGEPIALFRGSEAPWSWGEITDSYDGIEIKDHSFVTDGPFLFRDLSGGLCMLWSTLDRGVYKTGVARSADGTIGGRWAQSRAALYLNDGGHGMLFKALDGREILAIHQSNQKMRERLLLLEVERTMDGLRILRAHSHL